MNRLSCSDIEALLGDYLTGTLDQEQHAAARTHLAICAGCRESAALWERLDRATREAELDPVPVRLDRFLRQGSWELGQARLTAGRRLARTAAVAVPIAAAAAIGIAIGANLFDQAPPAEPAGRSGPSPAAVAETALEPAADPEPSASFRIDDLGRRIVDVGPGTALLLRDDTVAHVERLEASGVRLHLVRGYALADIGWLEPGVRIVIATPFGEVEARGTVFSVEVAIDGSERVRVVEGVVEVRGGSATGSSLVLTAGQELTRVNAGPIAAAADDLAGDIAFMRGIDPAAAQPAAGGEEILALAHRIATASSTETPGVTPADGATGPPAAGGDAEEPSALAGLVKQAQQHRKNRDFDAAIRTYQQVIERYPTSNTASNCFVALGQIELSGKIRPARALTYFEQYLAQVPTGALAEEARIGIVRSLDRLGRATAVIEATDGYLARHPGGRAAAEMHRRRGDARRRLGNCAQAVTDYRTVLETWPDSAQAERARSGLTSCTGD